MKLDSCRTVTWLVIVLLALPIYSVFGKPQKPPSTAAPSPTAVSPSAGSTKPGGTVGAATTVVVQRVAVVKEEVCISIFVGLFNHRMLLLFWQFQEPHHSPHPDIIIVST